MDGINTGGGGAVQGDVEMGGGAFTGRDTHRAEHSHRQSITMISERDVAALLSGVEKEIAAIHRQIQSAIFIGLFLIVTISGVAIFVGNQQINTLAATQAQQVSAMTRRMDLMSQQIRELERAVSRLEQALSNGRAPAYVSPYDDYP